MKIALVQINSFVGDVEGNSQKIIGFIKKAKNQGAIVVCFHELAILGYPPRDLLELPSVIQKCQKAALDIASYAQGIEVIVGTIYPNSASAGKPLFNAALWCRDGKIHSVFKKNLLPSYDVFDETRYFEAGELYDGTDYQNQLCGVSICEDLWSEQKISNRKLYSINPLAHFTKQGCRIHFNISASPYSLNKYETRKEIISQEAIKHAVTIIYVNQVGGNDELIFDGGSMVIGPDGKLMARAPFFKEIMMVVDLDHPLDFNDQLPPSLELLQAALICGLKDYVKKCGFKKVTLGLSGGIDSALTAAIAVKALGAKNVLGLMMPSCYSSPHSQKDAKELAKHLKIETRQIPIDTVHKAYQKVFSKMFGKKKLGVTDENIQARIRGNLLMAISNQLGHLVLSTGNKSELAVGYCTLYGDMSGGLAVISDLPKTLVYELARYINRKKTMIPESSITKAPSAELRPNQTDQDSLPPYEVLDGVLKAYIEEVKSEEEIIKQGYEPLVVKRLISMIKKNEYKRRQAAPGLRVTSKAFGMGRRFPIACK